jgi:hypothetical protein
MVARQLPRTARKELLVGVEDFDAAVVALGTTDPAALREQEGNPTGPACIAARAYERQTRLFSVLFTTLVLLLAAATAGLLVYAIYKISKDVNVTDIVAAVGSLVTGSAAGFLVKHMNRANALEKSAIAQVEKYCGTQA